MRRFPFLPFLAFAILVLSSDPLSLLIQSLEQEKKQQWMGKQVYAVVTERGILHFESIVKHNKAGKTRVEFLYPPQFAGYVMILERESSVIIGPKGKMLFFPRYLQPDTAMDVHIDLLSKSAKVSLKGEEKIIGHTARIFLIRPAFVKGGYLKIWVDKNTGIRLKTERYSPEGRLLSSITFLSLQIDPPLKEEEFKAPKPLINLRNYSLEELQRILRFRPLLPSELPRGYKILQLRPLITKRQRAVLIHLSDGINPITIMETPIRGHPFRAPYERDTVVLNVKGFRAILKGNVDREVLKEIGLSLK